MPNFKALIGYLIGLTLLASCNSPNPSLATEWCLTQPCQDFFGITIDQVSSSILVFILAFYGLFVAYKFYKNSEKQNSRKYWSYSLILGGLGALSAGISYQAFGYEIKCAGKEYCDISSVYEVAYNILSVWSAAFMLIAVCASFIKQAKQALVKRTSFLFALIYSLIAVVAYFKEEFRLLSFEFLMLYISPLYLFTIGLSGIYYFRSKDVFIKKYLYAWLILILTLTAYYIYLYFGITQVLWENKLWFSANDVLHIGMLYWLYYLSNELLKVVKD